MNKAVRKWLGVPHCLMTVALYRKAVTNEHLSVMELKCAKTRLEMTLSQSKDPAVTAPMLKIGKKWNPRETVKHAQDILQHRHITGQVHSGRAGFGSGDSWRAWGKATFLERSQMVTSLVRKQEDKTRRVAVAS